MASTFCAEADSNALSISSATAKSRTITSSANAGPALFDASTWRLRAGFAECRIRATRFAVGRHSRTSASRGWLCIRDMVDTLRSLGWTAGQTAQIDVRWMGDDVERGKGYAAELIALAPDVLFCSSSLATVLLFRSSV